MTRLTAVLAALEAPQRLRTEHVLITRLSCCRRVLSVDGKSVPYSCNTTIAYFPVDERAKSLSQAVQVTEVDVSTPRPIDALKIDMTAVVERGAVH